VPQLALFAFLASATGTLSLQNAILGTEITTPYLESLWTQWQTVTNADPPEMPQSAKQHSWDSQLLERVMDELGNSLPSTSDKARWRAVSAPHAGDWLLALPVSSCSLRLDEEAMRIAVGLRLGVSICQPHTCLCGMLVAADGTHGLSCSRGPGRITRHAELNDLIGRSLSLAGIPNIKEPPGRSRSDGKRPGWFDADSMVQRS